MQDWLMAPAFPWLSSLPWWAAVLLFFALGAGAGWVIGRFRTQEKLKQAASREGA